MVDELIDIDRVEARLDALWEIGKGSGGGVTRLAYSPEETEAMEYIISELPPYFDVHTDSVGNVFARTDPEGTSSLYLGSHLDTVFNGGRLDGTLGVVTAIEAVQAVHESEHDPDLPPTVAIFRGEESSRFGQHTIGSRAALGLLTVEEFSAVDQSDIPLWQAMQQAGFRPSDLTVPTINVERISGFIEVHIEQGRVLEESSNHLGLVTSIRAPVRYRVTVEGDYDHSGATPMGLRRDALAGAAEMITAIEDIGATAATEGDLVATVGDITPRDGAINTVCGEVSFPIDIRSNDEEYRDRIEARIRERIGTVAERRTLGIDLDLLDRSSPVELNGTMIERLEDAAGAAEAPYLLLPSGGGHDAMNFQLAGIPTGMVFTPSIDGISHNPAEETRTEAIEAAIAVLARTIIGM